MYNVVMVDSDITAYIHALRFQKDPIKKARQIKELHEKFDLSYSVIAQQMSVSPTYISNYLRLLKLPKLVIDGYYSRSLSLTHYFILSRLHNESDIISLYEETLANNYSALELEEKVRIKLHNIESHGVGVGKEVVAKIVEKFAKHHVDAKVKVVQTRITTKIVVQLKGDKDKTSLFLRKIAED